MRLHRSVIYLILTGLVIGLVGCSPADAGQADGTDTPEPQLILTAAAETAAVRLTEVLEKTPSATIPPATTAPTATQDGNAAATANATQEALLTQAVLGSPTATAAVGNISGTPAVEFVSDVTVPDGTDFAPREKFTKTWRLRNAGATTWTTAYALVYIDGDRMDGPDRENLPEEVPPGDTVDVSVKLRAPREAGRYRGYWKLLSPDGKFIDNAVYVEIEVIE
jgi:hypothetical protein